MKTSMNYYAPMWLLVLGLAFGLFSCEDDKTHGDPDYFGDIATLPFYITNLAGNENLIKSPEDSPYDLDYIHIIMHDGKRVEDLRYEYGKPNSSHPVAEGYVFISDFLGDITYSELQSIDRVPSENSIKYENKPFYLYLSPDDIDTLRIVRTFLEEEAEPAYLMYHNGKRISYRDAQCCQLKFLQMCFF